MKSLYLKFDAWFTSRVPRERWLLSVVLLLAVAWLAWLVAVEPAYLSVQEKQAALTTSAAQNQALAEEVTSLEAQAAVDPNEALRARLQRLERERNRLGELLDEKAEFMQPEQLLAWLEALLESGAGLTLEAFVTEQPQPFIEQSEETANTVNIMQYPVKVTLTGDFFAIHDYLEALSGLPLSFYWQGFDYQVEEHPEARVTLELFTLSYAAVADGN
ncbi:hypothetical protein CWE15_05300 [Aliidiomarina taiwanensis]|uniref:MSHA biogenesis protein MshJ n=1 Tax=Aliidiomarina taiwanensis TaxID=946228 RepID=A0A432X7K3_9GAMM|nr:type II secretion system protein GspM [Aliidiomarina taiwanensis]RUO42820.1 hypothetical protein CWE15_05300 [Aliidiomarina taiwanensis]